MKSLYSTLFFTFFSCYCFAQGLKVTGKVSDEKGEPLIGASIVEKGTNNGTVTDGNGTYSLSVGYNNATLLVTYVGYNKVEREINGTAQQDFSLSDATVLSQVTVVGSRNLNRSSTDTPAPVDVIDIREVTTKQGQLDVNQLLQFAAPSFNSNRQTGSDGADHVDPASLRGLGPDQTLVLINGKRRHQSALVNLFGSRGRGNTGTDLNAIPAAAIERIEILRDGAAAQYGSDAIAGVINIVLKETTNQLAVNANAGMFKAKYRFDDKSFDGLNYNVNLNYGWKIAQKGFLNVTADYNSRDHTNRANTVDSVSELARRQFGDPQIRNAALYYNAKIPLGSNFQVYTFGGVNERRGDAYAWTRFADDDRNIPSIYPNGFDPIITSKIQDRAITAGVRGVWKQWDIDLSNTYGFNKFHFGVKNSLNASFGKLSQTKFDAGGFQLGQNVTNLNISRFYKNAMQGVNLAFGGEYRTERYKIFAGERASYYNYNPELPGGAQGFPGYSPADVTDHSRSNVGAYVDLEADVTKQFLIDIAGRFEHYSDFGSTLNGKLGVRYKLNDVAFRGSVSTGFRAPSLAQKYFNSTFTNFVNGQPVEVLLASNNSAVTQALGIPQLKQETSQNASLGFTLTPTSGLSVTVDGYYVKVKNRVVLTGQFSDEDEDIGSLLKSLRVGQAQFFTNALEYTTTKGLDVIVAHTTPLGAGRLSTTVAANFNWMELGPVNTVPKLAGKEDIYFDERERHFVLASAPPSKINLTFDYSLSKFSIMLRFIRFGEIKLANWDYMIDTYSPKVQTDLTLNYKFTKNISLSIGGSNILNVYPDMKVPALTESGGAWDPVQMGTNGAFFFTRLGLRF